jgi:hypothetical protein
MRLSMAKEKPDIEWAVYVLRERAKYIGLTPTLSDKM